MRTGIFIDDTGSPGIVSDSEYDSIDRKTWMALILSPEQRKTAISHMKELLYLLKRDFHADEFHFKDIYNGKKEFQGVDLSFRLEIFKLFAEIFAEQQYPMLIQTFTPEDMTRNKFVFDDKKIKADNFRLTNTSDFALFFLLCRIKELLNSNTELPLPVEIIVDEGRQKPNTTQTINLLGDRLYKSEIVYKSSHDEPLLQLIDFVAFSMNRVRWILTRKERNDLDYTMLEIMSTANFNILNIQKIYIDPNSDTTSHYDRILEETYDKHSHLRNLSLEDLIKNFYK